MCTAGANAYVLVAYFSILSDGKIFRQGKIDLTYLENNPDELWDFLDGSDFEVDDEDDEEEAFIGGGIPALSEFEASDLENDNDEINAENEDDSFSSGDEIPLARLMPLAWKKHTFSSKDVPVPCTAPRNEVKSPWEYFQAYLNNDFFQLEAEMTERYYFQQKGKSLNTTAQEIKKFFGLHAVMGCIKFPRIHMYWNAKFKFPLVADVMPRDRLYLLRVNFHVVDNLAATGEEKENKLWKVQPMIELVRNKCRSIPKHVQCYSVDEQMIPFLGRCPVRQFVRNKPRPVGLKNFVVTSHTGLIHDFEIYQGSSTPLPDRYHGLGPSVVLRLVETMPRGSSVFFDRYFTTVPLMEKLFTLNIDGTGTIMSNRLKGCKVKPDKEMNRGDCEELVRTDQKLCVTKWMDNKSVLLLSTAYGVNPEGTVQRWDKHEKERVEVKCPNVVRTYNQKMGGVDICDQMIEYYRTFFKTRKWTFKVTFICSM